MRTTPEAARLRDLLVSHGACDAEICTEVKATARAAPRMADLMESLSLSDQEIVEKWRLSKEEAARRGTCAHCAVEAHLNRVLVPHGAAEFQLFSKFLGALRGLAASKFTNPWENAKFLLGRWMLERHYGARAAAMFAVCLHPDNGDQPFLDDVPVIPEIEELMAIQRSRPRESRATASEDASEIDPAGG
ncbi:unnamed protein product, partial [Prorocentrum cordatum]